MKFWYFILCYVSLISLTSFRASSTRFEDHRRNFLTPTTLEQLEGRLLQWVNMERKKQGLPLLLPDSSVQIVARLHSADMVKRDFFAHQNPDGQSPFDRMKSAGIQFQAAAENIAYASTLEEIHQGLMNSPGHKKNILNPKFGKIGIGIMYSPYGLMVTELFRN